VSFDQTNSAGAAVPDISVLIPVYNEIEGIDRCYTEVVKTLDADGRSYEIVFVDDGSADGSTDKLAAIAARDPRVTFVKLRYNIGQQRAMFAALYYCRGRAVITYDSDLQFHPECLPALATKVLDGYDIVGGIRVRRKDHLFYNRIPSYVGRLLINRALRIKLQDFGAVKAVFGSHGEESGTACGRPQIVIPGDGLQHQPQCDRNSGASRGAQDRPFQMVDPVAHGALSRQFSRCTRGVPLPGC